MPKTIGWLVAVYAMLVSAASAAGLNIEFLGDGSVRTSIVAGDGSVRPIDLGGTVSGDGSVRTLKGAHGTLNGTLGLQSLDVSGKPDPFIDLFATFMNLTDSAISFSFGISLPYLGGSYDLLTYAYDIDVKDGRGDGVLIHAVSHEVLVDGIAEILLASATACGLGPGPIDTLTDCDDGAAQTAVLSDPTGLLTTVVAFTLSPYDTVVLKGRAELLDGTEIPEPATLLLFGAGLIAWCAAGRRPRWFEGGAARKVRPT